MRLKFSASMSFDSGAAAEPAETIERWIEQAKSDDARAFNRLVDYYGPVAFHVAFGQLDDPDDAAECCQEAMLSAWRRIGSFSGDATGFRAWLLRIVANACIDRQRHDERRPLNVPLDDEDDDEELPFALADPAPLPEAWAELADLKDIVSRAMEQVPEPYRTTLLLYTAELSHKEIAIIQGVSVNTVCSRLARARARLRPLLAGALAADEEPNGAGRSNVVASRATYPSAGSAESGNHTEV